MKYIATHKEPKFNIQMDYSSVARWRGYCKNNSDVLSSVLIETENYIPVERYDGNVFHKICVVQGTRSSRRHFTFPEDLYSRSEKELMGMM